MTETELLAWQGRGPLWPRRLELMLAQVAWAVAKSAGNKVKLIDFDLFPPPGSVPSVKRASSILAVASQFKRKRGPSG